MSWQMRAVGWFVRATRRRVYADPAGAQELLTREKGPSAPPDRLRKWATVRTAQVHGFDVHHVRAPGSVPGGPVVVYLHGGAYVNEIVRQHWEFIAFLAARTGVDVVVPVYGLAPQHTAAHARDLCAAVLDATAGRPCWLAGDSSGAGLALLTAQAHVARGGPADLRGLTLMAPWLDLGLSNPGLDAAEARDPWLARAALREVAHAWADGTPLDDGAVSPLFGPMADLPPVDLWVGTRDLTHPDCLLLAARLREAGVRVDLHEAEGALHVFPLLPVPEGRRAAWAIRARIAEGLGVPV